MVYLDNLTILGNILKCEQRFFGLMDTNVFVGSYKIIALQLSFGLMGGRGNGESGLRNRSSVSYSTSI